ncbi:DUF2924 domain-containing protein [Croceicoccus ponticola]|uniref:DUF2924 domain-containing protein n=1 Tax=Croceicoccus ponticola TaxID=2217664 RepID=A0A437GY08_9SPHN|nr:DUF2924 domain-containing protein [Croceicoccus ponticola]RVQ67536.1 DUF2924 domain-containing protein [Croceicoccus ponticola]
MARQNKRLDADLASLADMTSADLQERWSAIAGEAPPKAPPALLRRLLAQRLQERRHGGLPVMVIRELERMADKQQPAAAPVAQRPALTNGTRLIREWNGQTIAVEVVEGGFSRDGRTYRSLSEIAREVTGAHWSGPRFFGLTHRG